MTGPFWRPAWNASPRNSWCAVAAPGQVGGEVRDPWDFRDRSLRLLVYKIFFFWGLEMVLGSVAVERTWEPLGMSPGRNKLN